MMKKRIVALLLAGLMTTTALASCRAQNSGNPNGTEPNQTTASNPQNTTNPNDPNNVPTDKWEDVGASVYTYKNVTLRKEANSTSTALASIPKETELLCIKQNKTWYFVEYDGEEGYILKSSATTINFLPTDFVPLEGGPKVMYANANINVRPYPIANDTIAKAVGSYSLNDEVTVVAQNGGWYQVKYIKSGEEFEYFVSKDCLEDEKVVDPMDDSAYRDMFEPVTDKPVMYTTDKVNLRATPITGTTENIIITLAKGREVTVTAKATLDDGSVWVRVIVEILPENDGDGIEKKEGYVSFDYLSLFADETTLDSLLSIYEGFTKRDPATTMYIVVGSTIFVRSTPFFPGKNDPDNYAETLGSTKESIQQLTVLADGTIDDVLWYIVEYTVKEGETEKTYRGFVGGKALQELTTDPEGKPVLTLEAFLSAYSGKYDVLETPATVTTKATNCYGTPDSSTTKVDTLVAGTEVLLVAQEKGDAATWAVIKYNNGYYFVHLSNLNQAN